MNKNNITDLENRVKQIELKELDVHDSKQFFLYFIENKLSKMLDGEPKETMIEYTSWHISQVESNLMRFSSCKRSLEIALDLTNYCKNINELNTKEIESWWNNQLTRNAYLRTGGDVKQTTNRKTGSGTKQKFRSQASKFIKFILFLRKNKPLGFFDTRFLMLPEDLEFLNHGEKKAKKAIQKPRVSQKDVSDLINCLRDGTSVGEATALMVSLCNDTGARYSELASLQLKDIKIFDEYVEISFPQSKTIPRVVISSLSKPLLMSWVSRLTNSNDKNTYLFSTKEKKIIDYANMRKKLKKALDTQKLEWKELSSFHFLRHLFVARAIDWATPLLNYWLGWSQKGMISVYGDFSVEKCKPHYFNMLRNENNPMLNSKLSYLETERQSQEEIFMEKIRLAVRVALKERK